MLKNYQKLEKPWVGTSLSFAVGVKELIKLSLLPGLELKLGLLER